jgi:hypothetical protein
MDADWLIRLEALGPTDAGDVVASSVLLRVGLPSNHAQADQRVCEEDRGANDGEDEEDVEFLTEIGLREGDGEVYEAFFC